MDIKSIDKRFRCEILSWQRVLKLSKKLHLIIKKTNFKPDIVIAIGRGGYIPARILCDYLLMKDLTSIKVEHWDIAATKTKEAIIKFPLCIDIKDKIVLLVDDITDTGDTLKASLEYLKTFKPKEIRTAVLVHKICSKVVPDYFSHRIIKWRWVIFPWHIWEDLTGFIKKLKEKGISGLEDIQRELKDIYNIDIDIKMVKEIISEI